MASIKAVVSEPIEGHEEYHMMVGTEDIVEHHLIVLSLPSLPICGHKL